ncbi:MAG TPA: radical SAM protein [Desulfuromonadales bacterium]|nr:radical SAM protein [Desulfuromonadales bacterium]
MLISLVSVHPSPSPQSIPLASAFLKAYALKSAATIELVDFFIGQDTVVCAAKLAEPCPEAVGFSLYVWNRDFIFDIAAGLRNNHPSIKLFCGGPEVTADPMSVIQTGIFDFVIAGEGEAPFLSLCEALDSGRNYAEIPGILHADSVDLQPPAPLADLDSVPSPYLTKIIDTHANPGILWQLSRGCSFTCDFCFDSRGMHGVRYFSLERLEAELQFFAATAVSQIFVLDSTFNLDPKRAKKILRMIKMIAPDIHFHFEVRNEFIDREMAALFAEIACSLQIGLQSSDREVLKLVGRTFNKADFSAKVGLLNESGAVFGFDLMYGLPGDTLTGFCNSLDYALSLYPNHLDIFPLAILPGTALATRGTALNIQWDRHSPYLVQETATFTRTDMTAAAELATACDVFYTRGTAVAWFNAVVRVLNLKPAAFLQKFSDWLVDRNGHGAKESDFNDDDIWNMQHLFLKDIFSSKKYRRYLPLVLDLAQYHHLYAATLLAPFTQAADNIPLPADLCSAGFTLYPATHIAHFSYDIDELLDCGEPQILQMYEHLTPAGSQAVIYRNGGAVCTESLALPYIRLLEQIRDKSDHDYLSRTGLGSEEVNEFLLFAVHEGIIEYIEFSKEVAFH